MWHLFSENFRCEAVISWQLWLYRYLEASSVSVGVSLDLEEVRVKLSFSAECNLTLLWLITFDHKLEIN